MEQNKHTSAAPVRGRNRAIRRILIIAVVAAAFVAGNVLGQGNLKIGEAGQRYDSSKKLPDNLDYKSVEAVYDQLRTNYDGKLTQAQVLDGLKKGLAESTADPYTEYFTTKEAGDFNAQLNNSFEGIGAQLGKDDDGNILIISPIAGFPAEKAGIKAQDIISTIDGNSTTGLSVDAAVGKIRGTKGTQVKLGIIRDKQQSLSITITRETIKLESVKTQVLDNNIGYISISSFAEDTSGLIEKAATDLKSKNVKGIVLDLRGNPGGLLDAAVDVSSQWLPSGSKILDEKRDGKVVVQTYDSNGPATLNGLPTVVLLDEGSASASEITAGALHDNKAAYIIGVKSYGKGVVQQTICVSGYRQADGACNGDMLKVTVASWYRPNGENINKKGIKPDQEVKITDEDIAAGKDTQKDAAIQYLLTKQ